MVVKKTHGAAIPSFLSSAFFEDAFTEEPTDIRICIFIYTHRDGSYSALLQLHSFNLLA